MIKYLKLTALLAFVQVAAFAQMRITNVAAYGGSVDVVSTTNPGVSNVMLGNNTGLGVIGVTPVYNNTFIGVNAGMNNTSNDNTFVGNGAGYTNTSGSNNTYIGKYAGHLNNTGYYNSFFGNEAGYSNTSGWANVFLGFLAGYSNTTGVANTFSGYIAGQSNSGGSHNAFFGQGAGNKNVSGEFNAFFGQSAGWANLASNNTFIGQWAGNQNTTGNNNAFLGKEAGYANTTGSKNLALGMYADFGASSLSNASAIGYNAKVNVSGAMVLGGTGTDAVKVGIGTATPTVNLHMESPNAEEVRVYSQSNSLQSRLNLKTGTSTAENDLHLEMYGASSTGAVLPIVAGAPAAVTTAGMGMLTTKKGALTIGVAPMIQGQGTSNEIRLINNVMHSGNLTAWECFRVNSDNGFVGVHTRTAVTGVGSQQPQALFHVNLTNPGYAISTATEGIRFEGLPAIDHPDVVVIDADGNLAIRPYPDGGTGPGLDAWLLTGNAPPATAFIGTTNYRDFRIFTNNQQRGKVTADGNFDFGSNILSAAVSQSAAVGDNNDISSPRAFSSGKDNTIGTASDHSIAMGEGNTINLSSAALAAGTTNQIGPYCAASVALGDLNQVDASVTALAAGSQNTISSSDQSAAIGELNILDAASGSFAAGRVNKIENVTTAKACVALGGGNWIKNSEESVVAGESNVMSGGHGCFIGGGHNITSGKYNVVLGNTNSTVGTDVHAYGEHIDNNLSSSIVMGFDYNRTMVVTERGVSIQEDPSVPGFPSTHVPRYNLEVEANPAGFPVASNIAFHHLPVTTECLPMVVVHPITGELFRYNRICDPMMMVPDPTGADMVLGDAAISRNVQPITDALTLINGIQPKKYQLDNSKYPGLTLQEGKETYGILAKDIEAVLPGLVGNQSIPGKEGSSTLQTVNYSELVPVLVQAVKDQQTQIKSQQATIDELLGAVKTLKQSMSAQSETVSRIDVALSDKDVIVLDQNIPNPADQFTSIAYHIPVSVQTAVMNFISIDGKLIKSVVLTARGKGVVNIYASELSRGTYTYSLIADGKLIDSKKMEITR